MANIVIDDFFKQSTPSKAKPSHTRPWWQDEYIIYSFTNPRVRSAMEKLMGTNVVHITDKTFMRKLQTRIKEDHEENVRKKIHDREVEEVEREKRLILEGKTPLEEAPEELSDHPVFKIAQLAKMILEERRLKAEALKVRRKIKAFDYNLLKDLISENDTDDKSEIEVALALHKAQKDKELQILEIEEDIEEGKIFTEHDEDRIKYEDPLVKELRAVENVDELYTLADTIVGPISNRQDTDDEEKYSRASSPSDLAGQTLLQKADDTVIITGSNQNITKYIKDSSKRNNTNNENTDQDISVIEVPSKEHTNGKTNKEPGWCSKQLANPCGLSNSCVLKLIGALLLVTLSWCLLYSLLHDEVMPQGDLFKILVLIIIAYIMGQAVALIKLPPLLGMLITGIVLRTSGFYTISGVYLKIVISIREIALSVILIKAGLGLDPVALLKLSLVVLRLAICPCFGEAFAAAIVSHFILGYPWLWGLLLGFMLGAVSPAVVVPTLLSLQERGYGEDKGISTLVIAASSLDDIVSISIFGICLGMIFSEGEMTQQILQGPLEMVIGLTVGISYGLLCGVLPHRQDEYVVAKRAAMVGLGGLCAVLGSEVVGFSGAGPLICITASFVACLCWKMQGWSSSHNPVADIFSHIWLILQPMLFGLIGAEIDLTQIDYGTVGYGMCIIGLSLLVRIATCCLVLLGGKLNFKEIVFVNLAWLPKATVQAALAPEALDMVRKDPNPSEIDLQRGAQVLTIAVLSILVTAPLGSIGISLSGPRLLSNKPSPRKQVAQNL